MQAGAHVSVSGSSGKRRARRSPVRRRRARRRYADIPVSAGIRASDARPSPNTNGINSRAKQIADHRLVRPYPRPRQHRARRLRVLRAQGRAVSLTALINLARLRRSRRLCVDGLLAQDSRCCCAIRSKRRSHAARYCAAPATRRRRRPEPPMQQDRRSGSSASAQTAASLRAGKSGPGCCASRRAALGARHPISAPGESIRIASPTRPRHVGEQRRDIGRRGGSWSP